MNPLLLRCITGWTGLALVSCSMVAPEVPGSDSRVKAERWAKQAEEGIAESKMPTRFGIPALVITNAGPGRKVLWKTGPGGRYEVDWWDFPKVDMGEIHNVSILASPTPAPVMVEAPSVICPAPAGMSGEEKRTWQQVEVPGLKRTLRYYLVDFAFGDTNTTWKSEIFEITAPDGRRGSYQVTVECDEAYYAKAQFAKLRLR